MSDPTNERHPSTMTEEDKQALRDSDPAAFEDDVGSGDSGKDGAGTGDSKPASTADGSAAGDASAAAGKAGGDAGNAEAGKEATGEADGSAKPGQDGGEGDSQTGTDAAGDADKSGKAPPAAVPRARLDEVIAQRNEAETLAMQQARELATLREQLAKLQAEPPKDFESEYQAVQRRYDEGDIDLEERDKEFRRLQREEFTHIANIQAVKTQATTTEAAVEHAWEKDVAAWSAKNPGFLEVDGNAQVMERAIQSVAAFHGPTLTNSELLEEASKLAFKATGYKSPIAAAAAPAASDAAADPAAPRRAQNAARAADASAAPPLITGGVGGRGGPDNGVDLTNLKPGTFSKKLSAAEQEKLLGEGAV